MDKGKLFVISGPSGVGKGTVCGVVLADGGVELSVSMTTRAPRRGERDGVDYRFVTDEEFARVLADGGFLECADVFGGKYGTPKESVLRSLDSGRDVILEIDVQGALQVRENYPYSVLIFVLPPTLADLIRRIEGRGSEDAVQVARRMERALDEIATVGSYDYAVVNDKVDVTAAEIKEIMRGRGTRLSTGDAADIVRRFANEAKLAKDNTEKLDRQ